MASRRKSSLARGVGFGLATIQHGLDKLFEFGFEKMKETGEKKEIYDPSENVYLRNAKKAGKTTLSFLGTIGDSYYERYEKLKKDD